jgi:biopolymer transport protein ExbD
MAIKLKAPVEVADINVTPMVDVMLVLLIIFMVITPLLQQHVSVTLAKAENPSLMPDASRTDAVVVSITRDGKIFLNTDLVKLDAITKQVTDLMQNKLDKTVFIKCDTRAKFGDVLSVVDAVRAAGIEQLGLLTEKVEKRPPLPPPASASP